MGSVIKYALFFILVVIATNCLAKSLYGHDEDDSMESNFNLRGLIELLGKRADC